MTNEIVTTRKIATAELLDRLFHEYLGSIRSKVQAKYQVAKDVFVPAFGEDGKPIYRYIYHIPPTQLNFCLYLGISIKTWWEYCNPKINPDLTETTRDIKTFFESYLETAALEGTVNHNFAIFNLTNNYGWKDQKEVELGKKTREAVQINNLSPKEKLEQIKALGLVPASGDDE